MSNGDQQNGYRPKNENYPTFHTPLYRELNAPSHSVNDVSALPLNLLRCRVYKNHAASRTRTTTKLTRTGRKRRFKNYTTNLFIRSARNNTNDNTAQGVFAKKSGVNHSKTAKNIRHESKQIFQNTN